MKKCHSVQELLESVKENIDSHLILYAYPLTLNNIIDLAESLKVNTKLLYLEILDSDITTDGVGYLADALKENQHLKKLKLSGNKIDETGAKYLAEALKSNESLSELNLEFNKIGDEGVEYLANALNSNKSLRSINLYDVGMTDIGFEHIKKLLINNNSLQEINIEQNSIKDKSAEILLLLKHNFSIISFKFPKGSDEEINIKITKQIQLNQQFLQHTKFYVGILFEEYLNFPINDFSKSIEKDWLIKYFDCSSNNSNNQNSIKIHKFPFMIMSFLKDPHKIVTSDLAFSKGYHGFLNALKNNFLDHFFIFNGTVKSYEDVEYNICDSNKNESNLENFGFFQLPAEITNKILQYPFNDIALNILSVKKAANCLNNNNQNANPLIISALPIENIDEKHTSGEAD